MEVTSSAAIRVGLGDALSSPQRLSTEREIGGRQSNLIVLDQNVRPCRRQCSNIILANWLRLGVRLSVWMSDATAYSSCKDWSVALVDHCVMKSGQ